MKKHTFFPCQMNEAILLITSYHQGQMRGWLSHSRLDNPVEVVSIPHFLFLLDEFLLRGDKSITYHAFESSRMEDLPSVATVRIRVLFQENSTWQGLILWEDRKMEAPFRSIWELIQILDEILAE